MKVSKQSSCPRSVSNLSLYRRLIIFLLGVLILGSCSFSTPDKQAKTENAKWTSINIAGSSGNQLIQEVLKKAFKRQYISSVIDDYGNKIKLSGHTPYTIENKRLVESNDIKVVLIYQDPRDNLGYLVQRSLYDLKNFSKPRVNNDALAYHQLITQSQIPRDDQGFVEYYVETIGAKQVLENIFRVTEWRNDPRVLPVKIETLIPIDKNDPESQLKAIDQIAKFLGVKLTRSKKKKLAKKCAKFRYKKIDRIGNLSDGMTIFDWRNDFTEEDKILFKKHFGQLLIDLGYEEDYNW